MSKKRNGLTGCMLILEVTEDLSSIVAGLQLAIAGRFYERLRYPHRAGSAVGFLLWRGVISEQRIEGVKRLLQERPPPRLVEPLSMRAMTIRGNSVVWRTRFQAKSTSVVPFLEWQRETIAALDKAADAEATAALNASLPMEMLRDAFRGIRDLDLFPAGSDDSATTRIRPPLVIPIAEFPDMGMAREAGRVLTTAKSQPFTPKGVALVEVRPGSGRICGVLAPVPFA